MESRILSMRKEGRIARANTESSIGWPFLFWFKFELGVIYFLYSFDRRRRIFRLTEIVAVDFDPDIEITIECLLQSKGRPHPLFSGHRSSHPFWLVTSELDWAAGLVEFKE